MRQGRLFIEWLLIGLSASLIVFLVIETSLAERADRLLYDSIAPLHAAKADDRLLIVDIDDDALSALGRWPWPRHIHAEAVSRIRDAGPTAILYDILFVEPSDEDGELAAALKGAPPTCLPLLFEIPGPDGQPYLIRPPVEPVASASGCAGTANLSLDSDGRARSIVIATPDQGPDQERIIPHMAELVYRVMEHHPSPAFLRTQKNAEALHIPFLAPGSFRSISLLALMRGEVPPQFLRNKIVLVGGTAEGLGDIHPVSTAQAGRMPGVEVQANLLSSLLSDRFITIVPDGWVLALSLVPLWGLLIAFWRLPPSRGLILSIAVTIFIAMGSALTLIIAGWWFPPVAALLGIALVYPLWGWRRLATVTQFMSGEIKTLLEKTGITDPEPDMGWSEDRVASDAGRLHEILRIMQNNTEERERMLQFLSHDMRSPQASIIALLEEERDKNALSDKASLHARIRRYAEHTLVLADDFVQLARLETRPASHEPVDVADAIAQAADMLWTKAKERHVRISRRENTDADLWTIGNPSELVRAFSNLIGNAISVAPEDSEITCTVTREGNDIVASIADCGPGLPPERRDDPFGRFGYSSAGKGGSGLGLAYVKAVAVRHKGQASYKDNEGGGACFILRLPAVAMDEMEGE